MNKYKLIDTGSKVKVLINIRCFKRTDTITTSLTDLRQTQSPTLTHFSRKRYLLYSRETYLRFSIHTALFISLFSKKLKWTTNVLSPFCPIFLISILGHVLIGNSKPYLLWKWIYKMLTLKIWCRDKLVDTKWSVKHFM